MAKDKSAATPKIDKDYQAESDLRCLICAEEIKRDKKRLSAALKKRDEMKKDLESVDEEADEEQDEDSY